jgi:excisionase family DNA binding protein
MTRALSHVRPIPRRGLSHDEAAMYVGVSVGKFDDMISDGRMPAPRRIDGRNMKRRSLLFPSPGSPPKTASLPRAMRPDHNHSTARGSIWSAQRMTSRRPSREAVIGDAGASRAAGASFSSTARFAPTIMLCRSSSPPMSYR